MEAMVYSGEFVNVTIAVAGLLLLFATAMAGILLFGYVGDQEAKGRRVDWLEEPLATAGVPARPLEKVELRKAA